MNEKLKTSYFRWAYLQIKDFKHYTGDLVGILRTVADHYFENISEKEFKVACEEAIDYVFSDGCEPEDTGDDDECYKFRRNDAESL